MKKNIICIILSAFLLSGCNPSSDIEKMTSKEANEQFTCKDCVDVKIKISEGNQLCLQSQNIQFPLYLNPAKKFITTSGFYYFPENDKSKEYIISSIYHDGPNNILRSYLMGKWDQDDVDGYGSANIYYTPVNDYVTLSVKKSVIENSRASYVQQDINGAIHSFCESYSYEMEVLKDKNNWTPSNDLKDSQDENE